jgi:hypothetical protein
MKSVDRKGLARQRALHRGTFMLTVAAGLFLLLTVATTRGVSQDISEPDVDEASCHDVRTLFVDGATLVRAKFSTELVATEDDWPEVMRLMETLAEQHDWSFRNTSESRPGVVETLRLSVCAPGQPRISVNEMRWASRDRIDLPIPERAVIGFAIHGDVTEAVWQPAAAALVAMLEARWPERVRFRDENSYLTDRRPDFLHPKP